MASTQDIKLAHSFGKLNDATPSAQPPIIIVFINGLMLPQKLWTSTITLLKSLLAQHPTPIYTLTYDRYGQGYSRSARPDWTPELHDLTSAANELESLLSSTLTTHQSTLGPHPTLIFVSHSIGVTLARLHNQRTNYPAAAHLFLDSNISNTDFVSLFPDPDVASFDPSSSLPSGATVDDLRALRERSKAMFHPSVPNAEGLDRSTVQDLVPYANAPRLRGLREGETPWLAVVGHDPVAFAEEGLRLQGTPVALNYRYMQPAWDEYDKGLLELSSGGKVKGVVVAKGAGHFIQRDTPQVVAAEVVELVGKVTNSS